MPPLLNSVKLLRLVSANNYENSSRLIVGQHTCLPEQGPFLLGLFAWAVWLAKPPGSVAARRLSAGCRPRVP